MNRKWFIVGSVFIIFALIAGWWVAHGPPTEAGCEGHCLSSGAAWQCLGWPEKTELELQAKTNGETLKDCVEWRFSWTPVIASGLGTGILASLVSLFILWP